MTNPLRKNDWLPQPVPFDATITLDRDLPLRDGGSLKRARLAYCRWGHRHLPAVLVLGGISAGRQAFADAGQTGWWEALIGPGKPLDPNLLQIVSLDYIGGAGDSEGPGNSRLAGPQFPAVTTHDQASAIDRLREHLAIDQWQSVIGSSYGGMVTQAVAADHPNTLRRALVIGAANQPWPMASAWRHVQRRLVHLGLEHQLETETLALARSLAMTTYRSGQEFCERFGTADGIRDLTDYLEHCGRQFCDRFDPYAYLTLSRSIDKHQIDPRDIAVPLDVLGFDSDQISPPEQLREFHSRLPGGGFFHIARSTFGHDAFLKETGCVGHHVRQHLETIL